MTRPTSLNPATLIRSFGLICGVVLLSQCTAPVSVRMKKPVAPAGTYAVSQNTDALLSSIRDDHERIRRGYASAIPSYNYSVARPI